MTYTHWILLGSTIALAAFDVWAAANKTKGDTLTEVIRRFDAKYPTVRFVFGIVMGHLFWSN